MGLYITDHENMATQQSSWENGDITEPFGPWLHSRALGTMVTLCNFETCESEGSEDDPKKLTQDLVSECLEKFYGLKTFRGPCSKPYKFLQYKPV